MRKNWKKTVSNAILGWAVVLGGSFAEFTWAGDPLLHRPNWFSGTYLDPALQRHDLLPRANLPEYREVYNRPRYWTGKLLHTIEPSSQEAMAWETNVRNGNYRRHAGPYVPYYYYPKPWEALNTSARPGRNGAIEAVSPSPVSSSSSAAPVMEAVTPVIP